MRIIIFWDSIAEWFWDYENGWWVNKLKIDYWKQFGYEKMIFNTWVSSYTSENVVTHFNSFFQAVSKRELWKEKDTIVIFAIWINDGSEDIETFSRRVSIDDFEHNIKILVEKCQSEILIENVIFLSATNVDENKINDVNNPWAEHFFYNDTIKEYNKILSNVATESTYSYIDMFWIMKPEDLEDGLHPNSKWHEKIYKKVLEFLEK